MAFQTALLTPLRCQTFLLKSAVVRIGLRSSVQSRNSSSQSSPHWNSKRDALRRQRTTESRATPWAQKQSRPVPATSPDGIALQRRLTEASLTGNFKADPLAVLQEYMKRGTADIEVARICLLEKENSLAHLPRRERRAAMKADGVGALTLSWLWSQEMRWVSAVQEDTLLIETLMYFLAAEDLDDYVLSWLRLDLPQDVSQELGPDLSHQWRGAILRHLIQAHLRLDWTACADPALRLMFSVAREVVDLRKLERSGQVVGPFAHLSLWPAEVLLSKQLSMGRYEATDPALYDQFANWVRRGTKSSNELSYARLLLAHPRRPAPEPALRVLKQQRDRETIDTTRASLPDKGPVIENMLYFFEKTRETLLRQGRDNDANWIAAYRQQLFTEEQLKQWEARKLRDDQEYIRFRQRLVKRPR